MKLRQTLLALLAIALGAGLLAPLAAGAAPAARGAGAGIAAQRATAAGARGTFGGTFDLGRFDVRGGELVAVGTLKGTVLDRAGEVVGRVNRTVALPVEVEQATCRILDLTLGPLDLDLLGLRVQLNRIHLRITAERGPGNLLGNLLCDLAGLLDGRDPAGQLRDAARLLNRVQALVG